MVQNNSEWIRLYSVILLSGMGTDAFAKHIGLT